MEDISDSDEHSDTIMLVEEDTVLEVLSEIEENTRDEHHSDFIKEYSFYLINKVEGLCLSNIFNTYYNEYVFPNQAILV